MAWKYDKLDEVIREDDRGGLVLFEVGAGTSHEQAHVAAAAPDLLAALDFLTRAARTEPGMAIYAAHLAQAEAAIAKARGK